MIPKLTVNVMQVLTRWHGSMGCFIRKQISVIEENIMAEKK